jgi:hypothetical protein
MSEARVRVHWNLHRGGYSVTVKGRVVATPASVCLTDVRFVVSDASLARMRRLGRRKVVAWAEGTVCDCARCPCSDPGTATPVRVSFNPWKADRFYQSGTGRTIETATHATFRTVGTGKQAIPETLIRE